jgi:hypothetical protein
VKGHLLEPQILRLLESGQAHKRMLVAALGCEPLSVDQRVSALLRARKIVILGQASEAGYTDIRRDAPVYGLPGMKLQPIGGVNQPRQRHRGTIASPITIGRGYSGWGGGAW